MFRASAKAALFALLSIAAVGVAPDPARACGNSVHFEVHEEIREVQRAERLLVAGKNRRAAGVARRVLLSLRDAPRPRSTGESLERRAEIVRAVAGVRMAMELPASDRAGDSRLRRALRTLGAIREASPSPLHDAFYAEALAAFPDRTDEAYAILTKLHQDDLMPSAWAYRVLARLSLEHGDAATAAAAGVRCRAMAADRADAICPALARS